MYRVRAETEVIAETFNPDLSTMDEERDNALVEIHNLVGDQHVITSETATDTGATAPFIVGPGDQIVVRDPATNQIIERYYQVGLTDSVSVLRHFLVFGNDFSGAYGGKTSMLQESERFGIRKWTTASANGTQSRLTAYDLSDKANKDLKKLVRGKLPADPVERFDAILDAVQAAKALERTPEKQDASGNPIGTLNADWDLP